MPYLFFLKNLIDQNSLYKIADDDSDKNSLQLSEDLYTIIQPTEEKYNKIKQSRYSSLVLNNSLEIVLNEHTAENNILNKKEFDEQISHTIEQIVICRESTSNEEWKSKIDTYINSLKNIDTSILTYPLNVSTVEHYCIENSIQFVNPLQVS